PSDPPPLLFALAERTNMFQRALHMLQFLWLLCQAVVDGLTQWMDDRTQEHMDMFNVLYLERYVLAHRLARGEEIDQAFPDELYVQPPEQPLEQLPEQPPEELQELLSPPIILTADSQNGAASRNMYSYPPSGQLAVPQAEGLPPSEGSQEQLMPGESREDVEVSQQYLAVYRNRRRTASELILSRYRDVGTVGT
ncbi:PIEZ1 protein, partial [Sapayoa aenigma]|nr:PIEZ1 protein [Sapayoa aenigma]